MANSNYEQKVKQAREIFNNVCSDQKAKLEFIKEIYETDGAANMNYSLDDLKKIMSLIISRSDDKPTEPKDYFRNNLDKIAKCDTPEDIVVLFKSDDDVIDEFCISYLTFKQCFDFQDEERATLTKIQNAIAKQITEFVFGAPN